MDNDRQHHERDAKTRRKLGSSGESGEIFSALRMVIAGGGTGGHLFPGIAIAQEFLGRNAENSVLFVGTEKPFEISILSEAGFNHRSITAEGVKGRGMWNQVVSVSKIPKGIFESILILKRFKPALVVGVGGYSAGPLVIGAWLLGIKIVLHEQNILPGITNRILSRFADRIYVSFRETQTGLNPKKTRFTGNPVRKEILQYVKDRENNYISDSMQGRPLNVLILGGSQGAHSINMALLEAVKYMENKSAFFIVHQTGAHDETMVKDAYERYGITGKVQAFFNDMGRQYQNADLIICRAGATTVSEIKASGKAAIFIPFPFAADNHQVLNARSLQKAGAAEMVLEKDLNGKILADRIHYYASRPDALHQMASKAGRLGQVDAAGTIVDDCYRLAMSSKR